MGKNGEEKTRKAMGLAKRKGMEAEVMVPEDLWETGGHLATGVRGRTGLLERRSGKRRESARTEESGSLVLEGARVPVCVGAGAHTARDVRGRPVPGPDRCQQNLIARACACFLEERRFPNAPLGPHRKDNRPVVHSSLHFLLPTIHPGQCHRLLLLLFLHCSKCASSFSLE
jgi:hypothetical protein